MSNSFLQIFLPKNLTNSSSSPPSTKEGEQRAVAFKNARNTFFSIMFQEVTRANLLVFVALFSRDLNYTVFSKKFFYVGRSD